MPTGAELPRVDLVPFRGGDEYRAEVNEFLKVHRQLRKKDGPSDLIQYMRQPLFIRHEDTTVGTFLLEPYSHTETEIDTLVIDQKLRYRGFGTGALTALEHLLRGEGIHRISLTPSKHAIPFYMNAGYTQTMPLSNNWLHKDI